MLMKGVRSREMNTLGTLVANIRSYNARSALRYGVYTALFAHTAFFLGQRVIFDYDGKFYVTELKIELDKRNKLNV